MQPYCANYLGLISKTLDKNIRKQYKVLVRNPKNEKNIVALHIPYHKRSRRHSYSL